VKATQEDVVDALQEHSRATAIVTVPVPPAVPNEPVEFVTVAWHRVVVGVVMFVSVELPHAAVTMTLVNSRGPNRNFTLGPDAQGPPAGTI
jgi:hypothetical protein